jgi:signal transduction histidine kinase
VAERVRAARVLPPEAVFARADALLPLDGRLPGAVLLPTEGLPLYEILQVIGACAEAGRGWTPVLVAAGGEELLAFPLTASPPGPLAAVDLVRDPAGEGTAPPAALIAFAEHVRLTRHAINNPLTVVLAETQLLLMDADAPDLRRALESIESEVRRVRDLVASIHLPATR